MSRFLLRPALGALGLALVLSLTPSAHAQAGDAAPSGPLDEALRAVAEGDLETAIGLLEPLREDPDTQAAALATLGALYVETGRPEDGLAVLAPLAEREDADAAVLYNAGRAALATGALPQAEDYLERSVALEGRTPATRELGLLRGAQKRYREAYALLRPWALTRPDDVEARRAAALCAVQLGRVAEANELLEGIPESDASAALLRGRLLLLEGEPNQAIDVLVPLLDSAPPEMEADVRRVLAETRLELGQSDEALALLEGHTGEDPASSFLLARAQYRSGRLEEALATLEPFAASLPEVGLDRDDPRWTLAASIAREYGRWLVNAGRNEEAIPFLRLATEADPDAKDAWKALGQALAATGDREAAREALGTFQELAQQEGSESDRVNRARQEREDPSARALRRAAQLANDQRPREALEVIRAERELAPQDVRLPILESRLLTVLGRPAEALQVADEAVAMAPQSADAFYQRGAARLGMEQYEEARADLERSLELAPNHLGAMNDLAVLLILQDERETARRLLERILELRPDDPQATRTLERLDAEQGS